MTIYPHLLERPETDVCVVGSGPVGIAIALACEAAGLTVTILEAGDEHAQPSPIGPLNSVVSDGRHAPISRAACRAFGGTSLWWGGRCVPLDDIDFASRDYLPEAKWPIAHSDLARWYPEAAQFLGCGPSKFFATSDDIGSIRFDELERWAPRINIGGLHKGHLEASKRISLFLNSEVTDLELSQDGTKVAALRVAGNVKNVRAKYYVLAGGGLGTARLLLIVQRKWPMHMGGVHGALGRYYMGHISGKIADLVLENPAEISMHEFFKDGNAYARRRFTIKPEAQQASRLFNTAFWADNPPFHDAKHRSGVLSLVWMALAFPLVGRQLVSEGNRVSHLGPKPWPIIRHAINVVSNPYSIATSMSRILLERFLSYPRKPGFLLHNGSGRYALHYHAEQAPNGLSRVSLSRETDRHGTPLLNIDFRYCEEDVESVLRSHQVLDDSLRKEKRAHLEYRLPVSDRRASVWAQAADGYHQNGLTRMGVSAQNSVTDCNCQVHGLPNLYLATSGVFPSSGQANSTFPAVALALRIAGFLANEVKKIPHLISNIPKDQQPRFMSLQ